MVTASEPLGSLRQENRCTEMNSFWNKCLLEDMSSLHTSANRLRIRGSEIISLRSVPSPELMFRAAVLRLMRKSLCDGSGIRTGGEGDWTLALRYLYSQKGGKVMLIVGTCFPNMRWIMCDNACLLLGSLR